MGEPGRRGDVRHVGAVGGDLAASERTGFELPGGGAHLDSQAQRRSHQNELTWCDAAGAHVELNRSGVGARTGRECLSRSKFD